MRIPSVAAPMLSGSREMLSTQVRKFSSRKSHTTAITTSLSHPNSALSNKTALMDRGIYATGTQLAPHYSRNQNATFPAQKVGYSPHGSTRV